MLKLKSKLIKRKNLKSISMPEPNPYKKHRNKATILLKQNTECVNKNEDGNKILPAIESHPKCRSYSNFLLSLNQNTSSISPKEYKRIEHIAKRIPLNSCENYNIIEDDLLLPKISKNNYL